MRSLTLIIVMVFRFPKKSVAVKQYAKKISKFTAMQGGSLLLQFTVHKTVKRKAKHGDQSERYV